MSDRAELRNPLYRNWVRAAIGLKYLQQGLTGFVSNLSDQRHQTHLYSYRKVTGAPAHSCAECTADNLLPEHPRKTCIQKYRSKCFCNTPAGRRICPNNFCSRFYDLIVLDHDETNPIWINTDPSSWYGDHWSYARCFLATAGYSNKQSAADTDAAGLLSILINNVEFRTSIDNVSNFELVRNTRNDILHSAAFEIEEERLTTIIDQFIEVLKDKKSLVHDADAQNYVSKLEKLKKDEIIISIMDAEELRSDALRAIVEKKDDALAEIDQRTLESLKHIKEIQKAEIVKDADTQTENSLTQTECDISTQIVENSDTQGDNLLSDSEKQELQSYLIDLYRNDYLKTALSPLIPEEEVNVDKMYVPLKMTKRIGNRKEIEHVCSINDIFYCKSKQAKCIYISGDAGIGKTTFCRKVISEWCFIHACSPSCSPEIEVDEDVTEVNICKRNSIDTSEDTLNDNSCSVISKEMLKQKNYDIDDETYYLCDSDASDIEYSSESSDGCDTKASSYQTLPETDGNILGNVALRQFELLLFISLRDTYKERSVEEMVKAQLLRKKKLQEYFNVFINNNPEKCLFILDGLDEWTPPSPLPTHPTVARGLPVNFGGGNFTILFTSRPWKLEFLRPKLGEHDLDVILHGIEEKDIKHFVKLVFDQMISNKDDVEMNTFMFTHELKKRHIESLCTIPLLAKLLVALWEKDRELADTLTEIYSSVISKLCEVALQRNCNDVFQGWISQLDKINVSLPTCLKQYHVCRKFSTLIHSLGKLAFETLFHENRKTALVFKDEELMQYGISEAEYELCLQIGLLSKKKVLGMLKMSPVICVSFIHKTFQEYFAAAYIAMIFDQDETIPKQLRESFATTEKIFDVINVLNFINSINPSIICRVTENIEINEEEFSISIKNNALTLKAELNNNTQKIAELLMSKQIHSIVVHSSVFGTLALRFPKTMENLDVLEFDSVKMTHSAFCEMIEAIPESMRGISLKIQNIDFSKSFSGQEECQVSISCKSLRSIEMSGMNIHGLKFRFSDAVDKLEWAKLFMVTLSEEGLTELVNSILDINHDVIFLTFDNVSLKSTVRQDSNILTQALTNLNKFSGETNYVRSITSSCFGNTVKCQNLLLDEVATGKRKEFLLDLKKKIETNDSATVVHITSTEYNEKTNMHEFCPVFATICLSFNILHIHFLHLTNIAVTDKALCEILSDQKLNQLVSFQMEDIDVIKTTSQQMYLLLECRRLVMKRVNMCDIQLSLSRSASSISLENVTFTAEGFLQLLNCIKEIMNEVTFEMTNISLTERLHTLSNADRPVQCGSINNFTNLLNNDSESSCKKRVCSLRDATLTENCLFAVLECILNCETYKLEFENIIINDTSGLHRQHILSFPRKVERNLLIVRNNPVRTWMSSLFADFANVCLEDVSVTENLFCVLLENYGYRKTNMKLILNKITITNTSVSERLVCCHGVGSLTIEQTNLVNILMTFPIDAPNKLCLKNITMTENAFCALLGERRNINIYSIELDNITLTSASSSCMHINFKSVYSITIKRTILSNIAITFHHLEEFWHFTDFHLENITMPEAALREMLSSLSSGVFDVKLDMNDESTTASSEQIGYKTIRRMVVTKAKKHHIFKSDFSKRYL